MRFQDYWERLRPRLDDAFGKQISIFLANNSLDGAAQLRSTLDGGKRIRGCLVCMVSDTLGGDIESAIPRAVAVELIQAATLIHDDFVDQDTVRRNRPATWTIDGARRAVLLGDVIFATANKMMNDLSRQDGLVVSQAIAQVARGAVQEPLNASKMMREIESGRWDGESYEKIIHLKTGTLFGAACQLGAITAEASPDLQAEFYRYGSRIGEAYQIADDLHDVKQSLSAGSIHPDRMVVLTPILLHFVKEMRPHILHVLEGQSIDLDRTVLEYLRKAARLMKDEIDRRLKTAVSKLETGFPVNEYTELIHKAPWEMVDMIMRE